MSRGHSRGFTGGARGQGKFGPPQQKDVLAPSLPPLYPPAPKACPLNPKIIGMIPAYRKLAQYFSSNYSVAPKVEAKSAFAVDRYTDRYNAPLALNPNVQYRLNPARVCKELCAKRIPVKTPCKKRKLKVLSIPETEENPNEDDEENVSGVKRVKSGENQADELEAVIDEEELDVEMDLGTDYAAAYFDNGEGYLDSDDDNMDDGPVY